MPEIRSERRTIATIPVRPAAAPPAASRAPRLAGRGLAVTLAAGLGVWLVLYRVLQPLAALVTERLLALEAGSALGESVAFFLFEAPKVLLLLVLVVFVVGVLRTFVTPERSRRILSGRRELAGNVAAAGLGVATPFCTCSAIPLFLGFVEAGVPLGVTFSFLIASPMVNEVALVLLFGLFGWRIALLYLVSGLALAIGAGWLLGRLRLERHVEPWVYAAAPMPGTMPTTPRLSWDDRVGRGMAAVRETVGKVWPYVVVGIAVGAAIHGYIPEGLLAAFLGRSAWWSVPLAVLAGVPMYAGAATIVPIVQALLEKGASLGTALAFMMAVIGLSLPEAIILRRVLRPPLIVAFVGIVATGILIVGYLFNLVA